jgi:hypothetical protein
LRSQPPPVLLESNGQPRRHHQQLLVLVAVAYIAKYTAIITKNTPELPEHRDHRRDVFVRRGLQAELRIHPTRTALAADVAKVFIALLVGVRSSLSRTGCALFLMRTLLPVPTRRIPTFPLRRAVIAEPIVKSWRGCHNAMDAVARQRR